MKKVLLFTVIAVLSVIPADLICYADVITPTEYVFSAYGGLLVAVGVVAVVAVSAAVLFVIKRKKK